MAVRDEGWRQNSSADRSIRQSPQIGKVQRNSFGSKYSLYSLRHTYAINALREGVAVYTIATNMGTSPLMIQQYYGKQATARSMATTLGGAVEYEIIDGKKVAVGSHVDGDAMRQQMDIMANMGAAELKAIVGPELMGALKPNAGSRTPKMPKPDGGVSLSASLNRASTQMSP